MNSPLLKKVAHQPKIQAKRRSLLLKKATVVPTCPQHGIVTPYIGRESGGERVCPKCRGHLVFLAEPSSQKTADMLPVPGQGGVGGIDKTTFEDANKPFQDARAQEPVEHPFAEKGTEGKQAAIPEPVESEIQDASFFKESEHPDVAEPSEALAFQNALQALAELASATQNKDIRACVEMTMEDLSYFHGGAVHQAATQSYGTGTPIMKQEPLAKPPAQELANPLNVQQQIPVENQPVPGQPLQPGQQPVPVRAAIEMHQTPPVGVPRPDMQRHLDEEVQQDIDNQVDAPVQIDPSRGNMGMRASQKCTGNRNTCPCELCEEDRREWEQDAREPYREPSDEIGLPVPLHMARRKQAIEIEEKATMICPSCKGSNHAVVDNMDGESLFECNDCGSFFTL